MKRFKIKKLTVNERIEFIRKKNPGVSSYDGRGGISTLDVVAQEDGWLDSRNVPRYKVLYK